MSISIQGIGELTLTLKTSSDLALGDLVTLSPDGQAVKAAINAEPIGVCVSRNGAYLGVQVAGGIRLAQDGTLKTGYQPIKAGTNGVSLSTAGKPRLVVAVTADSAEILL